MLLFIKEYVGFERFFTLGYWLGPSTGDLFLNPLACSVSVFSEHASGFHLSETLYLNAFMLIYFLTFNTYKNAFALFPVYSFDNGDMKSLKCHAALLSLIFLLKCFSKSFFITREN